MHRTDSRSLGAYLGLPLHLLQVATHAKSFQDNLVLGSRRLNERGLHVGRVRLAAHMAELRRQRLAARLHPDELAHFQANGYFLRQQALPPALFATLRDEIRQLRARGWEMRQGRTVTRRISLDREVLASRPACAAFVKDPTVRDLIAYASSHTGGITYQLESVLVDSSDIEKDPQTRLHADTFHSTAKAWLFLEDVADDAGPFSYVPGSHRLTPARLDWEYRQSLEAARSPERMHREGSFRIDAAELASLGLPAPVRFAVPANTLVVADTVGFHARCPSLRPSVRVEIYASLRRNPFLPWCGGHLFALPFVAERHMAWDLRLKHLLGFGRRTHWKALEALNAYDPVHL